MARLAASSLFSTIPIIACLIAASSAHPTQKSYPALESKSTCTLPANSTASSITWSSCPPELGYPEKLQCGNLSVPIDWDEPYGDHFNLGIARLSATPSNSTPYVGSLFANPGGPGGSATNLVALVAAGALQSEVLLASFDWIGVDPRGVRMSHQVECDMSIWAERVSLFPKNETEFDKMVDKNKRFGESCRKLTGPLLEHIDTASAAKDHEAVRIALGNEPINFLGLSYGSQLGAAYAELFPSNIRTLALDGITQHSQSESSNILIESSSYELTLTRFFKWAGTNESSLLQGQDVEKLWTSLLTNASTTPIPASGCNSTECRSDVNAEEILFHIQPFLANANPSLESESWGSLASALLNASQGDATAFSTAFVDPVDVAGLAIACLDWTTTPTFASMQAKQVLANAYTPLTRGASQTWGFLAQCIGWPATVTNPPKKQDIKTETTILLVNSESDPETGMPWALGMSEEIENNVLVIRKGNGHTSFALGGQTSEVTGAYLITGQAPEAGLVLDS